MPVYEYKVKEDHEGCSKCRDGFSIQQGIRDEALTQCPSCGAPIERLLFAVGIASPKSDSELRDLGFTKLVRRDSGVYENVTRTEGESRYFEADKPETMPDIKKRVSD